MARVQFVVAALALLAVVAFTIATGSLLVMGVPVMKGNPDV